MTIFNKPLSEYVRFARLFLVLIAIAGVTRLALSLSGAPNATAKWFSMTVLMWIAAVYYSIRVQTAGFGSYKHLLPVFAVLNLVAQLIAITAIGIAIFTGHANIFSAPEYAFGGDGKTWTHLLMHVFIGTIAGSVAPWVVGCGILALTRRLSATRRNHEGHHHVPQF